MHRKYLSALALLLWLGDGRVAAGAPPGVDLEIVDIGVKHQISGSNAPISVRLTPSASEPFLGEIEARSRPSLHPFSEPTAGASVTQAVSLVPGRAEVVCVDLPGNEFWDSQGIDVTLRDSAGTVVRSKLVEKRKRDEYTTFSDTAVGILTDDVGALKRIQDQILFAPRQESKELFEQPSAKFFYLSSASPPCWSAYTGFALLVVSLAAREIPAPLHDAIRTALLKGLRVVVHDIDGETERLLADYPAPPGAPRRAGRGTLFRVASLDDGDAWAGIRDTTFRRRRAGEGTPQLPPGLSALDVFDDGGWILSHFRKPSFPHPTALILSLVAYVLWLGPVSFVILRRRDARDLGWLTTPGIAFAFSALLAVWAYRHQFHESELYTGVSRGSSGSDRDVEIRDLVRMAWPRETTQGIRLRLDWRGIEHTVGRSRFRDESVSTASVRHALGSLALAPLHLARWSALDVTARGFVAAGPPVRLEQDRLVNLLPVAFDEALFVDRYGFVETTNLGTGAIWELGAPGARQDSRLFVRSSGPIGHGSKQPLLLRDAVHFGGLAEQKALLETVDGIFVGATREPGPDVELDDPAQVRRAWTVHLHAFTSEEP